MSSVQRYDYVTQTLPASGTDTGEALVVLRLAALAPVLAGFGRAGLQQGLTVFPWEGEEDSQ